MYAFHGEWISKDRVFPCLIMPNTQEEQNTFEMQETVTGHNEVYVTYAESLFQGRRNDDREHSVPICTHVPFVIICTRKLNTGIDEVGLQKKK